MGRLKKEQDVKNGTDRSLTVLKYTISTIGILVGTLTLTIAIIGGMSAFLGLKGYNDFKDSQERVKAKAVEVETLAKKTKDEYEALLSNINGLKSTTENKISSIEEKFSLFINKKKEEFHEFFEKNKEKLSSLSPEEKPSGEIMEKLDKFTNNTDFFDSLEVEFEPVYYYIRGLDYYYKDEYVKAKNSFERAIELDDKYAEPLNGRGVIFLVLEEYEEAIKYFERAIKLKPDLAKAWNNKGIVLVRLGKYERAIKSYEESIRLSSDFEKAWYNKGLALHRLGEIKEALKSYDKAIELKPDYADAWYNKACASSLIGDKEKSLNNLRKAMELDSKAKEDAKKDEDFRNLWDDEDFKKIVE